MGMLKAMLEEMEGDLSTAEKDEATATTGFEELSAAKAAEIASATSAIESKTKRSGEVAVEVVQTKDDLEDTLAEVSETEAFLGDLGKQCAEKKSEWAERQKMRAEEISAISEAIKVLNDDDALDLFKKTVPSMMQTGYQFLQKSKGKASIALRAKTVLMSLMQKSQVHATVFSLLTSALKSKSVDFSKITAQIDGMIDVLGKEQDDDDKQKVFCDEEFTKSATEKKETEEKLASLAASIEEMSATVATLKSEIETLTAEIKALDKAVAEATETRKEEHATFLQVQAEGSAAVQLIEAAKNKLNKFYNPTLYKAPERRELTEEERIAVANGAVDPRDAEEATAAPGIAGTGIAVFAQVRAASNAAPAPPPETFGAYTEEIGQKQRGHQAHGHDDRRCEDRLDGIRARGGDGPEGLREPDGRIAEDPRDERREHHGEGERVLGVDGEDRERQDRAGVDDGGARQGEGVHRRAPLELRLPHGQLRGAQGGAHQRGGGLEERQVCARGRELLLSAGLVAGIFFFMKGERISVDYDLYGSVRRYFLSVSR